MRSKYDTIATEPRKGTETPLLMKEGKRGGWKTHSRANPS